MSISRSDSLVISIAPEDTFGLEASVRAAGGRLGPPEDADAIVWSDPRDPDGLREVLSRSTPRWVQLPSAGIEKFVESGLIDNSRAWTCAKGIYGQPCAEHALALVLMAARCLHRHSCQRSDLVIGFGAPEITLDGATVLVVGTGGIGSAFVRMLQPLGAEIIAVNRTGRVVEGAAETYSIDVLPQAIGDARFVVLTVPVTHQTNKLIDRRMLSLMSDQAWIINVGRGVLVDTQALVEALREGTIGGAALDVTDPEPLPETHPLWEFENVVITPHVAATWEMSLPELRALVGRNVTSFLQGRPLEGLVNPEQGY